MANIGHVKQVIGPVVDIIFQGEGAKLPEIFNALEIKRGEEETLVLEVQQHLMKFSQSLWQWTYLLRFHTVSAKRPLR